MFSWSTLNKRVALSNGPVNLFPMPDYDILDRDSVSRFRRCGNILSEGRRHKRQGSPRE